MDPALADEIYNLVNDGQDIGSKHLQTFVETVFFRTNAQQIAQIVPPEGIVTRAQFRDILGLLCTAVSTSDVLRVWSCGRLMRADLQSVARSYGLVLNDSCLDAMMAAADSLENPE